MRCSPPHWLDPTPCSQSRACRGHRHAVAGDALHRADARGGDPAAATRSVDLARYSGALTSIEELDRAAAGRGLISVDPEGGVIRRIPLVASIDGTLVPALAIEMIRTAIGAPALRLKVSGSKVEELETGDLAVPRRATAPCASTIRGGCRADSFRRSTSSKAGSTPSSSSASSC
jgi:hypothetical protein